MLFIHMHRISQWKNTSTLWLHGFWSYDWADNYVRVEDVDVAQSAFVIDPQTPILYGMYNYIIIYSSKFSSCLLCVEISYFSHFD